MVPGDGFHVRQWSAGKVAGEPAKVTFAASSPVVRADIQTPRRNWSRASVSMSDLFGCRGVIVVCAVNLSDLEQRAPR